MALTPTITLYKDQENPTKIVQPFVPMKTFKRLTEYQKRLANHKEDDIDGIFDVLTDFAVELFQNKVTKEDLIDYVDFDDIMLIFFRLGEISKSYSPNQVKTQKK
jgi:hypothetical protein